jgi:hypothetical protein
MTEFKTDPRIALDVARDRLRYQHAFYDVIDSKIATLFIAASGILAVLVSALAIREKQFERDVVTVVVLTCLSYLLVLIPAAYTHWPRVWKVGPEVNCVYEDIQQRTETEVVKDLIRDYAESVRANKEDLGGWLKPWALYLAGFGLASEAAVVVAGLVAIAV